MPEDFKIEATNANGLPITPPQDTRSEEGYLKDLTVEGTLTMGALGEITNTDDNYSINENGVELRISTSSAPSASQTTIKWVNGADIDAYIGGFNQFGSKGFIISAGIYRAFLGGLSSGFAVYDNIGTPTDPIVIFSRDSAGESLNAGASRQFIFGSIVIFEIDKNSIDSEVPFYVNSTTDSTSKDTGSIITEGGVGVEKSVHVGHGLHTGALYLKGIHNIDTSISNTYTVTTNITHVRVDDSGGVGAGITLPAATGSGKIITVKDVSGTAGGVAISILRTGTDTIDGATSQTINTNYGRMKFIDGATGRWDII